jgi:eukaryotic-like serine/threonine-protein kinase
MTADFEKLRGIFLDAVEQHPPAEWGAYLDRACAGDADLRRRAAVLLKAHTDGQSGLGPGGPSGDGWTATYEPAADRTGAVVGPYKLLQKLGEGGMGAVWMAEQASPVRRKVAVKLVKPGMDSKQVLARFEAERQALALMDHPNIAKVFDAGATPAGRPYFVMELVQGVPITRYCDEHKLTTRQRLELFVPVCQAVQHAHQKGIIHRDLKPNNVLVAPHDGRPVPTVIDFGVVKAAGQRLTDKTLFTEFGAVVGTPEYMSPEQAELNQLDVDTRSDVYSLGVLLYELLTGTTPVTHQRTKGVALLEVLRIIREEEPPKPSTRLSTLGQAAETVSANRGSEPRKLTALVRGELDWIVMRALEKDRNRRYESASAFAADVRRYLSDEPVQACPPSAGYQVRKFVRRNRGRVAVGGVLATMLGLGVVGLAAALVAVDAERQRKDEALGLLTGQQDETTKALAAQTRALGQAYSALRAMTDDFVEGVLARQQHLGESQRAYLRNVVSYFDKLAREYGDSPNAWIYQGDGQWLVAGIRDVLGEHREAEAAYRAALAARLRLLNDSPDDPKYRKGVADCHAGLGTQLVATDRPREAEASFREAIALLTPLTTEFPDDLDACWQLARTYDHLGLVLRATGGVREAEAAYHTALTAGPKLAAHGGPNPRYRQTLADIHDHMAILLAETGRVREAEAAYRDALAVRLKLVADFPKERLAQRDLALSYHNLGAQLAETGRVPEAEAAFRESIARGRKLAAAFPLAPEHADQLANSLDGLGTLLTQTGRARAAEEIVREAVAIRRKQAADYADVPRYRRYLAASAFNLGNVLENTDRPKDAEAAFREAIGIQTELLAEPPPSPALRQELARSHNNLGNLLADVGRPKEAEPAYRAALDLQTKLADESPTVADHAVGLAGTYCNLGSLCQFHGRLAEAPEWYDRAIATLGPVLEQEPRLTKARLFKRNAHWGRADTLGKLNRHREALPDWDRALDLSPPPQRPAVQMGRALCLVRAGEPARATRAADELLAGPKAPAAVLYDAACVFALAAAAAGDDAPLRERHATRAVELLGRLRAQNYFRPAARVEHLKKDEDLAALRDRDDFRKLVAEVEPGAPPTVAPPKR